MFFLIIFLIAIVIYNNSKSSKKNSKHTENIIQLHGGTASLDSIINYCILQYENISIVVLHHHNPIKIRNCILGASRNNKLTSGFYIWMLPAHTILINKNIYIVDELQTFYQSGDERAYLTKITVADVYFPHIKRAFYVATLKYDDSYYSESTFSAVASIFDFLHKEPNDICSILIADFASQNWNFLNRDWKFSSGEFRIPTYVDDRGCVTRHGFLFNESLKGVLSVEQILDINIDSELLIRLSLEINDHKGGSIDLGTETEKITMSIKYRDCVNFVHSKIIPDKHRIVISDFVEYKHKNSIKIIPIEDVLNSILTKGKKR